MTNLSESNERGSIELHQLTPIDFLKDWRSVAILIGGGIIALLFLLQQIPYFWGLPDAMTSWAKTPKARTEATSAFYFIATSAFSFGLSVPFAFKTAQKRLRS